MMKNLNHIKIVFCYILIFSLSSRLYGQFISGTVHELDTQSVKEPVEFVNVYWSGTYHGTITDSTGRFMIEKSGENENRLVFSYVGYINDTVIINTNQQDLDIILSRRQELKEVAISKSLGGSYISGMNPIQTEVITKAGLQRFPCCNLSESFENSATIDAGYSDALTGARYIKMLGLAGIYSQIMFENIPFLRGLESSVGLNYVPGPWMESIQISKEASSVVNGYESTTGQINLEYFKPQESDPLFVNLFINSAGWAENNIRSAVKFNDKWNSMILAHASTMQNRIDRNKDTLMDMPMSSQLNAFNR